MSAKTVKDEARKLVESLADSATWDELQEMISTRLEIEEGLRDANDGRLTESADVRAQFGLSP